MKTVLSSAFFSSFSVFSNGNWKVDAAAFAFPILHPNDLTYEDKTPEVCVNAEENKNTTNKIPARGLLCFLLLINIRTSKLKNITTSGDEMYHYESN